MSEKIKVMVVMPDFYIAGAEVMVKNLVESYSSQIEPVVVSLYTMDSPIIQEMKQKKIRILFLHKRPGWDFSILSRLRKIFIQENPNVIHTHRYALIYVALAAIASKFQKIHIHTVHNQAEYELTPIGQIIAGFFYRRKAVTPIALTEKIAKSVRARYRLSRVPIVFNGVDINKIPVKSEYPLEEKIKYVCVARFEPVKNQMLLLDTFQRLFNKYSDIELHFFGDGHLLEEVKKAVAHESPIFFHGMDFNISQKLKNFDVFVLPSLWEGMPMTIIEAEAAGLPIVASSVGGVPDIVTEKNGILVSANNGDELLKAMERFVDDHSLIRKLGEESRKQAQQFTAQKMAQRYEEIYAEIAGRSECQNL